MKKLLKGANLSKRRKSHKRTKEQTRLGEKLLQTLDLELELCDVALRVLIDDSLRVQLSGFLCLRWQNTPCF
jgi:hypothetical protein